MLLRRWIDGANSGDVDSLVGMYAQEAILLPTFSPNTTKTQAKRREYFEQLVSRPGLSVHLHEKTFFERKLNDHLFTLSGIYRFSFEVDGEMLSFEARFTCVVDTSRPDPILHHHSSQIPRTLG